MSFFSKLKNMIGGDTSEVLKEAEEENYVELEAEGDIKESKILVRPFLLHEFESIKPILDCLRDGHTIALVNIKPLKDKDLSELKRAINKLKKTCDAIEGDIAGFGEDWIAIVPSFAKIYRIKKGDASLETKSTGNPDINDDSEEMNIKEDESKIETY